MLSVFRIRVQYGAGIVGIVFSVFLMALQDALVKATSADISLWQLFALRSVVAVLILFVILNGTSRGNATFKSLSNGWVVLRSSLLVSMYIGLYAVIPYIPLSTLAAGFYTGPIFIVIFSAMATGERVGVYERCAIGIGFVGVLLISKPTIDGLNVLALLPILSGACYALAAVMTRFKVHDVAPSDLALSLNVLLGIVGFLMLSVLGIIGPSVEDSTHHLLIGWGALTHDDLLLVGLLGVMLVAISISLAFAYRSAPPAVIAGFDYSYLIFASMFGFILFDEIPTASSIIGMLLIAGAGLSMLRR